MSSGAAYGKGIYMADQLSVSLGYAQSTGVTHWPKATVNGAATIVAVCEVVDRQEQVSLSPPTAASIFPHHNLVTAMFLVDMPARY